MKVRSFANLSSSEVRTVDMTAVPELVKLFCEGDRDAFEQLYKYLYPKLIRYGLSLGVEHAVVQDAIQELFIWIWQHPQKISQAPNPEAYIYLSIRNNLTTKQKQVQRREDLLKLQVADPEILVTDLPDLDGASSENIQIARLLDELPDRQREVLFLRYYEEKSIREISKIMGVSPQIVRNYAFRAIKKLQSHREFLEKILFASLSVLVLF